MIGELVSEKTEERGAVDKRSLPLSPCPASALREEVDVAIIGEYFNACRKGSAGIECLL